MDIRLNIALDGVGRVMERVRSIDSKMEAAATPAAQAMADATLQYMELKVREPKSGKRHKGYPRPSGVPGGYPAYQWGGLVGSFTVHTTAGGNATLNVGAGLPRPYHLYLEVYGVPQADGGTAKFPFVRPSVEAMNSQYSSIVLDVVRRYI